MHIKHTEENQEAELESQTDETQEAQAEAENDDNENLLPEEVPEMPSASEFIPESETEAGEENSQSDSPAVAIEENIVETQSEPAADEDSPTHETDLNSDETEISEEQNLEEDIENSESESAEIEETIVETQPESVADEQENETETEPQDSEILSEDLNLETETETESKDAENFELQYDFTSGERYVDKVSTKTEFDKMLDELAAVSKDLLAWEVEKFAKKYTGKFQGDFDKSESDAKKYEAFLGGYITNAAMTLYDNGYIDAAIKQLDQAKNILVARKKLEVETEAIKERVVEEDAAVDLSDILGMFGDG